MSLHLGDCLEVMPTLDAGSIDAIVTDPPYGLAFMGKDWDHGVPGVHFWQEALRVAKPGAHLVAFGGTRTYHRLTCAIEDAGWEIRDCLMWLYGSGFPKSHNGPWGGTALKPAWEPIILARKPLGGTVAANVQQHGTGALNIDAARIEGDGNKTFTRTAGDRPRDQYRTGTTAGAAMPVSSGRWPANVVLDEPAAALLDEQSGELTSGGVPPSRLPRPTSPADVLRGATGNPVTAGVGPNSGGASRFYYTAKASRAEREAMEGAVPEKRLARTGLGGEMPVDDDGRARDRFSKIARNHHPTVKPLDLMRWLVRLVTPSGGLILDPFMGSGTTGCAASAEGFRFIGIEREAEYLEIARARLNATQPGLDFGGAA